MTTTTLDAADKASIHGLVEGSSSFVAALVLLVAGARDTADKGVDGVPKSPSAQKIKIKNKMRARTIPGRRQLGDPR